jgi:hypothetical protein
MLLKLFVSNRFVVICSNPAPNTSVRYFTARHSALKSWTNKVARRMCGRLQMPPDTFSSGSNEHRAALNIYPDMTSIYRYRSGSAELTVGWSLCTSHVEFDLLASCVPHQTGDRKTATKRTSIASEGLDLYKYTTRETLQRCPDICLSIYEVGIKAYVQRHLA